MMKIKNWPILIVSILLCLVAGLAGSIFTISAIPTWYAALIKPPFSPPNYIFGPVWTTLYILMGISLYIIWSSNAKSKKNAIIIFIVQLVLNAVWSIIFFGLKNPGLAFIELIALWISIFIIILLFRKISKAASYLLYPYIAWVTFAGVLNFSIWMLNR